MPVKMELLVGSLAPEIEANKAILVSDVQGLVRNCLACLPISSCAGDRPHQNSCVER